MPTATTTRSLRVIAAEIRSAWPNVAVAAKPYLDSMACCETVDSSYGCEDGKTQVVYFLSNATTWRGDTAKRIKAELKSMIGRK